MAVTNLLRALEKEGQKEREEILSQAKKAAAEIIEEAETAVDQIKKEHLDKMTLLLHEKKAKALNQAYLDNKEKVKLVKSKLINQAFEKARKKLATLRRDKSYPKVLRNLSIEAFKMIPKRMKTYVRGDKRDATLLKKILEKARVKKYILKPNLNCSGGLQVLAQAGRISVLNTLEARLKKAQQTLESQVAVILFGK